MKWMIILTLPLLLAACSGTAEDNSQETQSSEDLDQAAIDAGILTDPDNIKLEGRFETRNDIGTDKFCAIKSGDNDYHVGILAVFGADSYCEGRGEASLDGENLNITLTQSTRETDEVCEFTASFDGVSLQLPGEMPETCAKYCNNRASLSGTQYFQVEIGDEAARKSNGREFKPLCKG